MLWIAEKFGMKFIVMHFKVMFTGQYGKTTFRTDN